MRFAVRSAALITAFLTLNSASADVVSSAKESMHVTVSVTANASADACWKQLVDIGSWWSSDHTWSGDASNLSIRPEPGGGFDEKLPGGGFVRHMHVVYSDPGKLLRMSGVLGPMQEYALNGTLTVQLKPAGEKTTIAMTYRVSGHFPDGLDKLAPIVDQVLTQQFQSLARRLNDPQ